MRESWKPVNNHPSYEVSNMGNIRNKRTGRMLSPYVGPGGYLNVKLDGKNCKLHILVAIAHVPNPENKSIVNHKRGNKQDPRASQLEWVTQSENVKHAWETGLRKKVRKHGSRKELRK